MPPEKDESWENQIGKLGTAGAVDAISQAMRASVAVAVLEAGG